MVTDPQNPTTPNIPPNEAEWVMGTLLGRSKGSQLSQITRGCNGLGSISVMTTSNGPRKESKHLVTTNHFKESELELMANQSRLVNDLSKPAFPISCITTNCSRRAVSLLQSKLFLFKQLQSFQSLYLQLTSEKQISFTLSE